MSRPANSEMVEGFRDGYDLTVPEPSSNRSASYRHGFMVGRIDKTPELWGTRAADELRSAADEAMAVDEQNTTSEPVSDPYKLDTTQETP